MVAALEKAREGEFRETKRVKASADAEIFIVTKDRCGMSYSCVRDGCVETQVVRDRRSTIEIEDQRSLDLEPTTYNLLQLYYIGGMQTTAYIIYWIHT